MGDDLGHHRIGLVSIGEEIICWARKTDRSDKLAGYRDALGVKLGHRRV